MARKLKPGRKRKPGIRTASGRLSRSAAATRDLGTAELQSKRAYLINGSHPQLAATASGILLANGIISEDQHVACLRYAHAHSLVFGKVWSVVSPLAWELPRHGTEPTGELAARARERIDAWNARLTPEQRQAIANAAVFGFVPQFFYTARLGLRELPDDRAQREALLSGLEALVGGDHFQAAGARWITHLTLVGALWHFPD